jgi:hypothetical protein
MEENIKKLSHLQLMLELAIQEDTIANAYSRKKEILAEVRSRKNMLIDMARQGKFLHDMEDEEYVDT